MCKPSGSDCENYLDVIIAARNERTQMFRSFLSPSCKRIKISLPVACNVVIYDARPLPIAEESDVDHTKQMLVGSALP